MDVVLLHNEKAGDESWSRDDLLKLVQLDVLHPWAHARTHHERASVP